MAAFDLPIAQLEIGLKDRGVDRARLSKLSQIDIGRLDEIFSVGKANIGEIEEIGKALRVSFTELITGNFRKPEIPTDYRTENSKASKMTPEVMETLDVISGRFEVLQELGAKTQLIDETKNITNAEKVESAARSIRRLLGVSEDSASFKKSPLIYWKTRIETRGVVVFFSDLGGAARGLSVVSDALAAIAISKDERTPGARLFGLLHELGHIVRRQSALSDFNRSKAEEVWCNRFAAHCLMPATEFKRAFLEYDTAARLGREPLDALRRLAARFGASLMAVALHIDNLRLYDEKVGRLYRSLVKEYGAQIVEGGDDSESEKPQKGGPNTHFYATINQLGIAYIDAVLSAQARSVIDKYEASDLTGVKYKHLAGLRNVAQERVRNYL